MSNTGIPLQSAQNPAPQPDEDLLAMLGLHPAQLQVAHGLASGAIHPQEVLDAATPPAPISPASSPTSIAGASIPPDIARPADQIEPTPAKSAPTSIAPPPVLSGQALTPRIAPPLPDDVQAPTRLTEDQAELARVQRTGSGLQQFQQRHPIAGTIARIGAGVGSAFFPGIAENIPGTDLHHQVVLNQDRRAVGEDLGEQKAEATIGETGARTAQAQATANKEQADANVAGNAKVGTTPEATVLHDLMTGNAGQPRIDPNTNKPYQYIDAFAKVYQAKQDTKPTPSETAAADKQANEAIATKAASGGFPLNNPKTFQKNLDAATKAGIISKDEAAKVSGYETFNATPSTNLEVKVAGQDEANQNAINKMFEGGDVLAHMPDGSRQIMSYADAKAQNIPPEKLVKLNAKESQDERDKIASVKSGFQGLDRYRAEFKNSAQKLTDGDRDAMRVLTTHAQNGTMGNILAGMFDEIPLVGPMNQYANKLLEGTMTSDQYKQLSPAGEKLVSDYFTSVVDNFASMKARLGSVGRNPAMIQAETNTIPLPYLDWDSANVAFENKRATMAGNAQSMPAIYTPGAK